MLCRKLSMPPACHGSSFTRSVQRVICATRAIGRSAVEPRRHVRHRLPHRHQGTQRCGEGVRAGRHRPRHLFKELPLQTPFAFGPCVALDRRGSHQAKPRYTDGGTWVCGATGIPQPECCQRYSFNGVQDARIPRCCGMRLCVMRHASCHVACLVVPCGLPLCVMRLALMLVGGCCRDL